MKKHTLGPWTVYVNLNHVSIESDNMPTWKTCWPNTSSEGHIPICSFRTPESKMMRDYDSYGATLLLETNLANARLISAAPELLASLKLTQSRLCEHCPQYVDSIGEQVGDHTDECIAAMDVIAKAEGEK